MKRLKKFSFSVFILLFVLHIAAFANGYHYAVTDMTWKEFYAGEIGDVENLDAYTSATVSKRFPEIITDNNSVTGIKAVQVRMNEKVYQKNISNGRYSWSDKSFSEYKNVNEDGTFGAMISTSKEIKDTKLTLEYGAGAAWGSYIIKIENVDLSSIIPTENLLGMILETTDGSRYALRPAENYWRKSAAEIGLTVDDAYVEIHGNGVVRDYKYFSDVVGKTINKIIYLVKNSDDVILSGFELKIPKIPTVRAKNLILNENLEVNFDFSNGTETAYTEVLTVLQGGGKKATALKAGTDYAYNAELSKLIIKDPKAGLYQVIFKSSDENIAPNIRAGFYVK